MLKSHPTIRERLTYSAFGPSDPLIGKIVSGGGRPEEEVLYGPIPISWLTKAVEISGTALWLGLVIWHVSKMRKGQVSLTPTVCQKYHLIHRTVQRLLRQLETAGLVSVDRKPSQAPRVSVILPGAKKPTRIRRVK
jgi:hypothetical protein